MVTAFTWLQTNLSCSEVWWRLTTRRVGCLVQIAQAINHKLDVMIIDWRRQSKEFFFLYALSMWTVVVVSNVKKKAPPSWFYFCVPHHPQFEMGDLNRDLRTLMSYNLFCFFALISLWGPNLDTNGKPAWQVKIFVVALASILCSDCL